MRLDWLDLHEKTTTTKTNERSTSLLMSQGVVSIQRCHLTSFVNTIVEVRGSYDRLISAMGFPILVRWYLYTESGGHLNINMPSYQYRDYHVKDKTVSPTVLSLTWESPYPGKDGLYIETGTRLLPKSKKLKKKNIRVHGRHGLISHCHRLSSGFCNIWSAI